jgi:DNA-binding Lrp family transcriptional regulator
MSKPVRKLDRIDVKILATLQTEGRITNLKLAEEVGLSPSPCLERVKRLEAAGYIRRYIAELDLDRLARNVMVFAEVTLKNHKGEDYDRFDRALAEMPEVVEAWSVGGGYDYLLKFVCSDIKDYQALSESLLNADIGIDKFFSYVVIKNAKPFGGFPLAHLLARDEEE